MSETIKCMKLDFLLLKPYMKSMLLALLVPIIFPFFTGTLFEGLSFAATVIAMTTGYCIYAGVQIPGYYRFGSIKGKMFMFIPTVGFLLFYYIARLLSGQKGAESAVFTPGRITIVLGALGFIAVVIVLSALISTKIVGKNSR